MKKSITLSVLSILALNSSYAGTMGPAQAEWNWVAALSAGPVWANGGSTQTFFLTPEIEKTYTSDKSSDVLFDGEVFLGIQKNSPAFQGQLGLAVAATSNATLKGEIWDDANPQFNNFVYSYKLQHTHVALKGKLLADRGYFFIPWVSASVGVGFNNAYSFRNTPVIFEAITNPNFASHTNTTFTYTAGAGIQRALNQNWQVGVGYEFADWGRSKLGRAFQQTLNDGPSLDHLYTNGVLFNITYLS